MAPVALGVAESEVVEAQHPDALAGQLLADPASSGAVPNGKGSFAIIAQAAGQLEKTDPRPSCAKSDGHIPRDWFRLQGWMVGRGTRPTSRTSGIVSGRRGRLRPKREADRACSGPRQCWPRAAWAIRAEVGQPSSGMSRMRGCRTT